MANNFDVKDAAGADTTVKTTDNAGVHTPHQNVDNVVEVDATGQGDVPVTLDSEVVAVDATGQGDVPVTLDGESVAVASIAAGDNNIGNVDIASALPAGTNNIGDVDVLSLPGAVQGPGNPTIDSYASAVVDLAASTADQELIAAPGENKQIWVYGLAVLADTAAGTITLQDEDDTALSGTMAISDEGGFVINPSGNFAMPWIKVATNKALEADTGACTVDGIITYAVVSV